MKRSLSVFLALIMMLTTINAPVFAEAVEIAETVAEATETVETVEAAEAELTLSGEMSAQVIDTDDAVVTLDGLTINANDEESALSVTAQNVTLIVNGDVSLTGGTNGAGIYVAEDASVTILGTGSLTAIGNAGQDDGSGGAAGIGGTYTNGNSGAITIDGVTVVAKGYGVHGSGIGSGSGKVVGEIKIVNGAEVTAFGGYYADGAGSTLQSSYGKSDPEGGAAIGGGGKTASTIAPITITDSSVVAYGGSKAAGIGANFWCSCEKITITNSDVTAFGGSSSAAIGTSRAGDTGVGSTIIIEDSTVNATGGAYGAGIGAGYNADSLGNGAAESALLETAITISGGNVTATGGEGGAAIGGGYKSDNVAITITDNAVVTATAGELVSGKTVANGGAASAIGTGANGSGSFENTPAADISGAAQITVIAHDGGKDAVAGISNEDLAAKENVSVVTGTLVVTYDELVAALNAGEDVVLGDNITCTGEINGTDANIDLNGKTLAFTVGGTNFYGTSTVKNGTIDITGCVASGDCIIGIGDYSNNAALTFDNVNITGDNYSSAYAVLYVYNESVLNINGGSVVVSNDTSSAGGVIKAEEGVKGKINITNAQLAFTNAKIGMLDGTVVMDGVTLDITGGANAINQSALTVKNSTLTIQECDGRALTLSQGDVVIENSTLDFSGASEGEIRFKKGLTLSVDDNSTIVECGIWTDAEGANVNGVAVTGTEDESAVVTVENGVTTIKNPVTGLSGSGTEADPYLISNLEELIWFRDDVDTQRADGTSQYAGKYILLTADIDLAGINWNPIGSMTGDHNSFQGIFDGGNHTISNLYVETKGNGLGLFARTAGNAVIKNLTINNATLISNDNSNYLGTVVANSYASTKIENVHVTGELNISGRGYIGGISGHGYVVMDNVSVVAEGTISSTFWCAGGILGYAGEGVTDITNATVEGAGNGLTVTSAAGGLGSIVGMAEDNNGTQPISGANLTAKNIAIKTYVGAYGTAYADYALGYLYGGNDTSILTGELVVEGVTVETSTGVAPTIVDAVAKVGDTIYFDFKAAVAAAQAGDTVTLLKDIADAGTVSLKAGVTLDGNGKTISGNSAVYMADGEVTVQNVNFKDIHNAAGKLSAIYATGLTEAANVTITGCTFENIDWDAIQLTSKNDVTPKVTITNNVFKDDTDDTVQQKRHLHIELGTSTRSPIDLTVSGNKFYGEDINAIGAWYINPEGSTIKFQRNYVQNPDHISVTYNTEATGTYDVSEIVLPLYNEDLTAEIGYAAKLQSATDVYTNNFYQTVAEAVAAANAGDTVTLLTDVDGDVSINKAIVFDGNSKTITGKLSVSAEGFTVKNVTVYNESERALYVSGNGTFENCVLEGVHGARYCYANNGDVVFTNCVLSGTTYGVHFDAGNGEGKVIIDGCEITGWTSFGSAIEGVTIKNTTFNEGAYNQLRFYQNVTLENCTFNPEMTIDFGKNEVTADFTNCSVTDGSALTEVIYLPDIIDMGILVTIDGVPVTVAAKIGDTYYATLADAVAAAAEGETVIILADGTYKLPEFSKNITIKAAEDVAAVFNMSSAVKITAATFENVTFTYATTSTYKGIQHSSDLTYNNCTFNGQVFLYAANETFTNCTFNTDDAANYNVWTYGAKNATFTGCTFNSAGKSVLIYNEGAGATDAIFTNCTFIASAPVEGKAAIEVDTTLMPDGTDIVINNSTATGFAAGSVSGNTLWNDKKDLANLTVTVDGEKVWPMSPTGDVTYGIYGVKASGEGEKYRENFQIDIYNIYAKESLAVKLYAEDGAHIATTTLREADRDDETAVIARPIEGSKTANIVVAGRLAGSWDTEWHVAPSVASMPYAIEVYADGVLVDTYTPAMDADDMTAYVALTGVAKAASVTDSEGNVTYYATLADAVAAAAEMTNPVIDLLADVTYDISAWDAYAIGGETTATVTINGNGHTLTFNKLNSDWNNIVTANDATLILNNMTITDSGYNNGPWNRYDLNFGCDVVLNNVTATKALAFKADANLNGVTINENGDNYAIWIQANGQNVTIDGLNVTSAGRGIKIDDQYVTAQKVDLSIENATFITNKKAAILVKSAVGANITAGEGIDISNVKADTVNLVWVDADAASTYDLVNVTGASKWLEDGVIVANIVRDGEQLGFFSVQSAVNAANSGETIILAADATGDVTIEKDITIDLNNKTLNGAVLPSKGNITIQNGSIVNTNKANSGIEVNEGNLTLTNVNIDSARHAVRIDGAVTAVIDGGSYRAAIGDGTGTYHAVNVSGAADVTIKDGTFTGPKGTSADSGSAVNAQAGATVTIEGGYFSGGKLNTLSAKGTLSVKGGTYDQDPATYVAEGYLVAENADGTYSVKPELPTATVTEIANEDLTFALNFKADEVTDAQLAYYGSWYADFVLSVNKTATFNANGGADGYLSGQYDAWHENWVSVPFEDVTMNAGESLKIMEYAAELMGQPGLKLSCNDVYSFVKDFDCGVYFTPEFLAANPDLKVTLELRVYNPANEAESYVIGETYSFEHYVASVTDSEGNVTKYKTLNEAFANAPLSATVTLLSDAVVDETIQIKQHVVFDGNGHTITGTSKKTFEVYASFRMENVTIENTAVNGRCVDTRVDSINVKLTNVNLVTTGDGNTQPITVGGYETESSVNMVLTNVTIDAGTAGYGIITFVPNNISIIDSEISGYAAIYEREGSAGSNIKVTRSTLTGINNATVESGSSFATVVFLDDNIHFKTDTASVIEAVAQNTATQAAVDFRNHAVSTKISATMTATGENAMMIKSFRFNEDKEVIIGSNSLQAVKEEGYIFAGKRLLGKPSLDVAVADGVIDVTAICKDAGIVYLATYNGNKVVEVMEVTVNGGLTTDSVTMTKTGATKVKAFLWDMDTLVPVCEAAEAAIN